MTDGSSLPDSGRARVDDSPVELQAHDPHWLIEFEIEAAAIQEALDLNALAIEHFGSTAAPGLLAKPIVDILVGVREGSDAEPFMAALDVLGYDYLGDDGRRPGRRFWQKRRLSSFNVSTVPFHGDLWESNIAVRDFLRAHPEWRDRYADAKRQAIRAAPDSAQGYQARKRSFVDELRSVAVAWTREGRR